MTPRVLNTNTRKLVTLVGVRRTNVFRMQAFYQAHHTTVAVIPRPVRQNAKPILPQLLLIFSQNSHLTQGNEMRTHSLRLKGCSANPLANYLKALGIHRLVAEQADPIARRWWQDDGCRVPLTEKGAQ